jgi:hypothetical protein
MLPTNHFAIAVVFAAPAALLTGHDVQTSVAWAGSAGLVSALIDLDVYAMVVIGSGQEERLQPFRSFINIYRQFDLFMETISQTGILQKAMATHLIISALVCFLAWFFTRAFFYPVLIAVLTHILSDIPNILKVLAPRQRA